MVKFLPEDESTDKDKVHLMMNTLFLPEDESTDKDKVHLMMNALSLDMTKVSEVRRVGKVVPGKLGSYY